MKNLVLFLLFTVSLSGLTGSFAQQLPSYPIPSYNVTIDSLANFSELTNSATSQVCEAKREINVQVKPKAGTGLCSATIWIYSLDQSTVLGPYSVSCGSTLTIEIDDREWGVLVESDDDVIVDVWIE
jgi:hypothetical protein